MRNIASITAFALALTSISASAQVPSGDPDSERVLESLQRIQSGDGSRAGDEALTCEQIGMEMQAFLAGSDMTRMVSAAQRADQEVNKTQGELAERQKTEAPALEAAAMAEAKASAGMVVNPLTNVPAQLAAKRNLEALTQAQLAKAKTGGQSGNAALQDYKKSASDLVTNNEDQLIRMQALAQLAETKGCAPPQ